MKHLASIALVALAFTLSSDASGQQVRSEQDVLGPGVYIYQTRLDRATCEEDSVRGYVTSYYAAIDGTPGAREMTMSLLNTQSWPRWTLVVRRDGTLVGDASFRNQNNPNQPRAHFEVRRQGEQLVGRGYREYFQTINGRRRRCRNEFDALLKRLDLRQQ